MQIFSSAEDFLRVFLRMLHTVAYVDFFLDHNQLLVT
jgi:hypothetical protein